MPSLITGPDLTDRDRARAIMDRIDQFDAECEAAEYTDTDEVWEILSNIRDTLAAGLPEEDNLTFRAVFDVTLRTDLALPIFAPDLDRATTLAESHPKPWGPDNDLIRQVVWRQIESRIKRFGSLSHAFDLKLGLQSIRPEGKDMQNEPAVLEAIRVPPPSPPEPDGTMEYNGVQYDDLGLVLTDKHVATILNALQVYAESDYDEDDPEELTTAELVQFSMLLHQCKDVVLIGT